MPLSRLWGPCTPKDSCPTQERGKETGEAREIPTEAEGPTAAATPWGGERLVELDGGLVPWWAADIWAYILSLPSRRNQNQRKGRNGILGSLPMTSQPHLEKRKVLGGGRETSTLHLHPPCLFSFYPFCSVLAPTTLLSEGLQSPRSFSAGPSSPSQLLPSSALSLPFLPLRCQWHHAWLLQPSVRGGCLVPLVGAAGLLQARVRGEWALLPRPGGDGGGEGQGWRIHCLGADQKRWHEALVSTHPSSPSAFQCVSTKSSGHLHDVHSTPQRDRLSAPGPRAHQRHPGLPDPMVSSHPLLQLVPSAFSGSTLLWFPSLCRLGPSALPPGGATLLSGSLPSDDLASSPGQVTSTSTCKLFSCH